MSIRQSGLWCDVCNKPMMTAMCFGGDQGWFTLGITDEKNLNACKECKPLVHDNMKSSDLPEGPIKTLLIKWEEAKKPHAARDKE